MKQIILILTLIFSAMETVNAQNQDFIFMIEQAIKAPSGHNTQPWLFKINRNAIEIHPDFSKSLPVVDADNRELFVSLGCATENLCIAASKKGYLAVVSYDKNGVISIDLTKSDIAKPNPLFEQIAVRQTNRSIYDGVRISDEKLAQLENLPLENAVNVHFYERGTADFDTIADFIYKGNAVQMQDEAFKQELRQWMRYNKKHQDETNDGLSYAVFGAPNLPRFIVKPIMAMALNEKSQNKNDRKKIASASHFVLFTTNNNSVKEWIHLGRSLQRFLLKSTELGIVHSYMNPPNEIRALAEKMKKSLNISGETPTILLRIGFGKAMPYSKRKPVDKFFINDLK